MYSFQLLSLLLISCWKQNLFFHCWFKLQNSSILKTVLCDSSNIKGLRIFCNALPNIGCWDFCVNAFHATSYCCLQIIFHYHFCASIHSTVLMKPENWNMVFILWDIDMFGQLIHWWLTSLLLFDQYTSADPISLMLSSQVD